MNIAIVNQKGGVGKTTTAINLACGLGLAGKKVLLVDLDPQGNCSSGLGVDSGEQLGITSFFKKEVKLERIISIDVSQGVDIIPSDRELFNVARHLWEGNEGNEFLLKEALREIEVQYDYVLFDCPPALNILSFNGMVASQWVLVPVQCQYFALEGLSQILATVKQLNQHLNPVLQIAGFLLTMYEPGEALSQNVHKEIEKYFPEYLISSRIHKCSSLGEAPSFGKSIFEYEARSSGSYDYLSLTKEIIQWSDNLEER